jgi:hypothetical protein
MWLRKPHFLIGFATIFFLSTSVVSSVRAAMSEVASEGADCPTLNADQYVKQWVEANPANPNPNAHCVLTQFTCRVCANSNCWKITRSREDTKVTTETDCQ